MNQTFKNIARHIEAIDKPRSAWGRGVHRYARFLCGSIDEGARYSGRYPTTIEELRAAMLNGARDWKHFSYGGSALAYDVNIAEVLCTKSELKRKRGGLLPPNSQETWLDVQARALFQAARLVEKAFITSSNEGEQ